MPLHGLSQRSMALAFAPRSPTVNAMRNRRRLDLIRIGAASAIPEVLHDLGADAQSVLSAAGLDTEIFADPDNVIPFAALERLALACVAATGCEHFGLLVGQKGSASTLGLVGLLAENSPDVRTALDNLVRHLHIHDGRGVPILNVADGTASLGYTIFESSMPGVQQIIDGAVALDFKIMRGLCGGSWRPIEVSLPRAKPRDPRPFQNFFEAPVRFGAEHGALTFTIDWLAHRIAGANPLIRKLIEDRIGELDIKVGEEFGVQLRRLLRTLVLSRRCSLDTVAKLFNIEARTLARRLEEEKIEFRSVVAEVRYQIARHLLADTSLTVSQVAAVLDYSELSAFTRAFRRWSGTTPMDWRNAASRHQSQQ
ncbi:AraC-type DNA-binding protein [Rhizobiales bacterium GAS191]|jgi:AraC-like DNA-binding protein|nr:AraC-type DNA-binding protein [Rhizobiales bacterium GAS113]SEC26539.1 AraC-type DNA-binding protein [Rhizobiales bacterium GAS188]SEC98842.1 AraC-type DNA-binding protein [Rhizobiales bacterium GAS191]